MSKKVEVHLTEERGIQVLIENETNKFYFNPYNQENIIDLEIRNIELIAMSPLGTKMAYFNNLNGKWYVNIISYDFQKNTFVSIEIPEVQ